MSQIHTDRKVIEHLEWIYPRQEVSLMSTGAYGLKFHGMVHKSDLEKINHIGFEVAHIQSYEGNSVLDYGLILTIKDRRTNREGEVRE